MPLATDQDSCREYARNVGRENPNRAWINTPQDSWERNPFYCGPAAPHPEEEPFDSDGDMNRAPEWTGFDSAEMDDCGPLENPERDDRDCATGPRHSTPGYFRSVANSLASRPAGKPWTDDDIPF